MSSQRGEPWENVQTYPAQVSSKLSKTVHERAQGDKTQYHHNTKHQQAWVSSLYKESRDLLSKLTRLSYTIILAYSIPGSLYETSAEGSKMNTVSRHCSMQLTFYFTIDDFVISLNSVPSYKTRSKQDQGIQVERRLNLRVHLCESFINSLGNI